MPTVPDSRPVALITGASRGIGATTAHQLARQGYALVLAARSADALAGLAAELAGSGTPVLPVVVDLRQPADVARLARQALDYFGRVDVLINNAGVSSDGLHLLRDTRDAADLLALNLAAPIALTRALLPAMVARRSGSIIFIASVAGHIGMPGSSLYNASKFGLRGFAEGLRREVVHLGLKVMVVSPGFIETAMTARLRVPKAPPEIVAQAISAVLRRPRREVIVPGWYHLGIWADRLAPGLMDVVMRLFRR